jgi:hypothetical protein
LGMPIKGSHLLKGMVDSSQSLSSIVNLKELALSLYSSYEPCIFFREKREELYIHIYTNHNLFSSDMYLLDLDLGVFCEISYFVLPLVFPNSISCFGGIL